MPGFDGRWTPAALAYVRVVARLRARGHSLEQIKRASDSGQLAIGPIEDLLSGSGRRATRCARSSRESGLQPALIGGSTRRWASARCRRTAVSEEDLEMMRYVGRRCSPPASRCRAYLQLLRVYGQVIAQIADAEVRLMHLYVHEPLMRAGRAERRDRRGDGGR